MTKHKDKSKAYEMQRRMNDAAVERRIQSDRDFRVRMIERRFGHPGHVGLASNARGYGIDFDAEWQAHHERNAVAAGLTVASLSDGWL